MPQVSPVLTRDALASLPFEIGIYTYGTPKIHWWGEAAVLKIGKFCSIAENVEIFVGGNHRTDWITTYPFSAISHWPEAEVITGHPTSRGDVVIGNDVWIASGARILSGVQIGNGAVIGAGAVVRDDVPPYAIVIGNPSKVVRYRFEPWIVASLERLQWWDFEEQQIRAMIPYLMSNDIISLLAFTHPVGRNGEQDAAGAPGRKCDHTRVFDCFMYNGEADVVDIRLNELSSVVDLFVVVESTMTFSGLKRTKMFDETDPRYAPFRDRIRHIMVDDMPETDDPWVREAWQRDAITRGITDARTDDLIIISDADEIPRRSTVAFMRDNPQHPIYALGLRLSFFYLDYCNTKGPVVGTLINNAVRKKVLYDLRPEQIRTGVRTGAVSAVIIQNAGWHFSYLMDNEGIRRKINNFSHQEYNYAEFLHGVNVEDCVRSRKDLFGDNRNIWSIVPDGLPQHVLDHPSKFQDHLVPRSLRTSIDMNIG